MLCTLRTSKDSGSIRKISEGSTAIESQSLHTEQSGESDDSSKASWEGPPEAAQEASAQLKRQESICASAPMKGRKYARGSGWHRRHMTDEFNASRQSMGVSEPSTATGGGCDWGLHSSHSLGTGEFRKRTTRPSNRISFLGLRLGMTADYTEQDFSVSKTSLFHACVAVAIILNGILIGVNTDYMTKRNTLSVPLPLRVCECAFCVLFLAEFLVRLFEERLGFFGEECGWNCFDAVVVTLQVTEQVLGFWELFTDTSLGIPMANLSAIAILRILRLVRIVRFLRILRFIGELRTIVTSIVASLKNLVWTVALLMLMMYTFSIYFTQLVLDYRLRHPEDERLPELMRCWSNIGRSCLTLFESISGGMDWDMAVVPLAQKISMGVVPVFCLYIVFATMALMNVVTGVFVESAMDSANKDKESYMVQTARELFKGADPKRTGVITLTEFERQLRTPELKEHLKALGINAMSARGLFKALDLNHSGTIDADELLTGTLRLRGQAKAIDIASLIYETRWTSHRFKRRVQAMDRTLARIDEKLDQRPTTRSGIDGYQPSVVTSTVDGMDLHSSVYSHPRKWTT